MKSQSFTKIQLDFEKKWGDFEKKWGGFEKKWGDFEKKWVVNPFGFWANNSGGARVSILTVGLI